MGFTCRLCPVKITVFLTTQEFIPMILNTGTGSELQRLPASVVIGIISSARLTLFVMPALHHLLYKEKESILTHAEILVCSNAN
jgi:cobalt-zinc-cadmium resistance protein CzcA